MTLHVDQQQDLIGILISGREVESLIAAGGMGIVYKVLNVTIRRPEAMKILRSNGNHDNDERFLREIRTQGVLDHDNIVKIYEPARHQGMLVVFMAYVDGKSVQKLLEAGDLTLIQAVEIILQVLDAVEYLHTHKMGIIHRDIKPPNIMVEKGGRVKLLDFGIAKATNDAKITKTGITLGSCLYMSPEQARGQHVTSSTDIYSIGVCLYEMTTGKRPFNGNEFAVMHAHIYEPPPPPSRINPRIPKALEAVILKAMAKDPADRFHSAADMRAALAAIRLVPETVTKPMAPITAPLPAVPVTPVVQVPPPVPPPVPPKKVRLSYRGAAVLSALLLLAAGTLHYLRPQPAAVLNVPHPSAPQPPPFATDLVPGLPKPERVHTPEPIAKPKTFRPPQNAAKAPRSSRPPAVEPPPPLATATPQHGGGPVPNDHNKAAAPVEIPVRAGKKAAAARLILFRDHMELVTPTRTVRVTYTGTVACKKGQCTGSFLAPEKTALAFEERFLPVLRHK